MGRLQSFRKYNLAQFPELHHHFTNDPSGPPRRRGNLRRAPPSGVMLMSNLAHTQMDLPPQTPPSEHLIGPDLSGPATVFVRGEGVELIDSHGRRYLDAMSGVGVACLGYGVSEVVEAMRTQAEELAHLGAPG